jgi:DNA-binding MarR family transcriptional regulator
MRLYLRDMRETIRPLDALFPRTRQAVLAATLVHSGKWWYLSDLARHLGSTPSSLQRELLQLSTAGILLTRKDGKWKPGLLQGRH